MRIKDYDEVVLTNEELERLRCTWFRRGFRSGVRHTKVRAPSLKRCEEDLALLNPGHIHATE